MFPDTTQANTNKRIIYLCPSTPKGACQWEGDASDIFEHFHDSHKDLLMDSNTIKADVTRDSEQNRLMASEEGLFLAQTKVCAGKAKMWIRLRFLGSQDKLSKIRYSVEVIGNEKFGFTNENSSDEFNPVFNAESGVEVDIQAINLMTGVGTEYVTLNIRVSDDNKVLIADNEVSSVNEDEGRLDEEIFDFSASCTKDVIFDEKYDECDEIILAAESDKEGDEISSFEHLQNIRLQDKWELKHISESSEENAEVSDSDKIIQCTNCQHNMIPPIYMCPDGHSVCYSCRNRNCRLCEQRITELRNIDLEEHSKTVEHPCRYEFLGCTEKYKFDQIRKHEIHCEFCLYKCELCSFEGRLQEIKSHFRIAHPSTKMYDIMTGIHFPKGSNFVIINNTGVFYCTSRATETYVEWKVVFCGPKERYFSCEVRITGKKQYYYPKHYFLKRHDNVFKWTAPFDELKSANVKEKNSMLFISSY